MIDLSKYTKQLSNLFSTADNILLISHINPDGDAIGSQIALYQFLTSQGKKVSMLTPNYLQEFLKWMDGSDQISIFIQDRKKCLNLIKSADLIVMLDFNQPNRMGEAEEPVIAFTVHEKFLSIIISIRANLLILQFLNHQCVQLLNLYMN